MITSPNYDVTALGELLVDFTEQGVSERGNALFEANAGGAPCNLLAMLAKLGRRTAFLGKVGDDAFGRIFAGVQRKSELTSQASDMTHVSRPHWR